jgi:single-stranded DNA-binding protein
MNEDFYMIYVATRRTSGVDDILPVMVSSRLVDITIDMQAKRVEAVGSWRSHNFQNKSGGRSLKLFLFSETFQITEKVDENIVTLAGTICKYPVYRRTPLGRQITDVCLAVNRQTVKSDYIPVVAWSREAMYLSTLNVGDQISFTGRIQSRLYRKHISETEYEERIAYEVSIYFINGSKAIERSDNNGSSYETSIKEGVL